MGSMKAMFNKILSFLNLLDFEGNLSITNVAVIVLITKIAMSPVLDWATAATLLVTLINYGHKRYSSIKAKVEVTKTEVIAVEQVEALNKAIEANKDQVETALKKLSSLSSMVGLSGLSGKRE